MWYGFVNFNSSTVYQTARKPPIRQLSRQHHFAAATSRPSEWIPSVILTLLKRLMRASEALTHPSGEHQPSTTTGKLITSSQGRDLVLPKFQALSEGAKKHASWSNNAVSGQDLFPTFVGRQAFRTMSALGLMTMSGSMLGMTRYFTITCCL